MTLNRLKAKVKGLKYLPFEQDGKTYNLYDMPQGFVIKGTLALNYKDLTELPDLSEVVIEGSFICYCNQLTSLKGAPKEVGGDFHCYSNQLTSLEGAPQKIDGHFNCSYNKLTSLEGAPKEVGGDFDCHYNQLTSLEGAPQEVRGDFSCHNNQLTSLKGGPQKVSGNFHCDNNELTSLVDIPQLAEGCKIYCKDSLGNKYGFSKTCNYGIKYEELCASPFYKSEAAMNRVRNKQQKTVEPKQQEAFEKINAEFSQWLKNNSDSTRE